MLMKIIILDKHFQNISIMTIFATVKHKPRKSPDMEQSQIPFKLPTIREIKSLNEEQLSKIFFELERHRAKELLDASEEYNNRIDRINLDYTSDFKVLSDILEEIRSKTA